MSLKSILVQKVSSQLYSILRLEHWGLKQPKRELFQIVGSHYPLMWQFGGRLFMRKHMLPFSS